MTPTSEPAHRVGSQHFLQVPPPGANSENNSINSSIVNIKGNEKPIYEAESPDELALVDAAFVYDCKLLKRAPFKCVLSTPSKPWSS